MQRRDLILGSVLAVTSANLLRTADAQAAISAAPDLREIEEAAREAYAKRDFRTTLELVDELVAAQPSAARWHEMRAAVRVDGKQFESALTDFNQAINATPGCCVSAADSLVERARLLAGRALAYEGLAQWEAALGDYNTALDLARQGGQYPDPYVLNSRGNVQASLARWKEARQDYLKSAAGFQKAAGFRDSSGSSALRLDDAVVAASNAALALVQLGDEPAAILEMRKALRRAPGSADLRAALAALYWSQGNEAAAESEWNFACERISVGCSKYQDKDWLSRIRRWPSSMVDRMTSFLALASSKRVA
ncbi:TPR-like protein [Coccomyxa subellipsoidea C-169]|uniref:TPR-like protein n=1 Tax=Coccomyxa subellipsoidea (strain C-169) TaxID=574566 RepID=I0YTX6_COCSC|nr:TPR-like protein [Coccomyxa subellipsoidea C-169]EIE21845.1 TPR-like protein [Coccomyxa subellipsoidea C-169]|eukprot:XP_005646389.1 TPR-like protein [Coccomyxa subellipsoidea C-169]